MRGIVQYEVYVLDQGRWSLHARYPGAQRADAVMDASATESVTGRATKVVRDTYWPELNENEEVTTYLSPKARSLQALRAARRPLRAPAPLVRTAAVHPASRRPVGSKRVLATIRLIVALGLSLLVASTGTAALSIALHRAATTYEIEPGTITIVLTICYLLSFVYVFPKAYRTRMRLHQVLAEMWENTDSKRPAARHPPRRVGPRPPRPTPPGPPWQPPVPAPAIVPGEIVAAPVVAEPPAAPQIELPSEKTEPKTAPVATAKAEPEAKTPPPAPPEAAVAPGFMPGVAPEVPEGLSLERIILRRFAVDVVLPSVARANRDDPVTRRGIALLMAGAVEGLTKTNPVSKTGALALLAEALRESGAKLASIESFLGNYETHVAAPNAQGLLAAGCQAIEGYVDGVRGVERDIQQALVLWRFPSTARVKALQPEFYLFSIAREESLTDGEPSVGLLLHQAIVRGAAQEFGGIEVLHDGAGTLVRFTTGQDALTAARAVHERIVAAAGPSIASVIVEGPPGAPGVPEDVAGILDRAHALLAVTVDGEIVCDATLHRDLGEAAGPAEPLTANAAAVRLLAPVG